MAKQQWFDIEIDKLTRSIENAISGDSFKTEVLELKPADIRKLKKTDGYLTGKRKSNQLTRQFTSSLSLEMKQSFRDSLAYKTEVTTFLCH